MCPVHFPCGKREDYGRSGFRGDFTGVSDGVKEYAITIKGIQHVPSAANTLLSGWQFLLDGKDVWFDHTDFSVNVGEMQKGASNSVQAKGFGKNGMFGLRLNMAEPAFLGN
ncbi:hypothetical protein HDU67_001108, partial [Dinochytrium kinnereticum]